MKSKFPILAITLAAVLPLAGCISGMISKMNSAMHPPSVLAAITRSDTTEIKRQIDSSADVINQTWFMGYRSMLGASPSGWMTEWLIAHGADVNLKMDDGTQPLFDAVNRETDASEVITAMAKHGANVNNADTKGYRSRAARERELNAPAWRGSNDYRESYSTTVSVKKGGVDVAQFYQEGKTALHAAALMGVATNVRALVKAGAKIDATEGADKLTPLHVACAMVNTDAAEALVELGANINAKTDDDETPLKLVNASESTHDKTALIAYLKAHGAKEE